MIASDLRQMSNPELCKAEDRWSPAMQSLLTPGRGRAGGRIWRGLRVAGWPGLGRGLWRMWLRGQRVRGLDGGGLPVTPVLFGIASPLQSLAPGP
jgi:hypothetical protein